MLACWVTPSDTGEMREVDASRSSRDVGACFGVSSFSTTVMKRSATASAIRAARAGTVSRTVMLMSTVLSGASAVMRDASCSGVYFSPSSRATGCVT